MSTLESTLAQRFTVRIDTLVPTGSVQYSNKLEVDDLRVRVGPGMPWHFVSR
jgi:hypothetical protein